jgi:hypothetical protein
MDISATHFFGEKIAAYSSSVMGYTARLKYTKTHLKTYGFEILSSNP